MTRPVPSRIRAFVIVRFCAFAQPAVTSTIAAAMYPRCDLTCIVVPPKALKYTATARRPGRSPLEEIPGVRRRFRFLPQRRTQSDQTHLLTYGFDRDIEDVEPGRRRLRAPGRRRRLRREADQTRM